MSTRSKNRGRVLHVFEVGPGNAERQSSSNALVGRDFYSTSRNTNRRSRLRVGSFAGAKDKSAGTVGIEEMACAQSRFREASSDSEILRTYCLRPQLRGQPADDDAATMLAI